MSISVNENLSDMRAKYNGPVKTFTESKLVSKNPIIQFEHWLEIARSTPEIHEPHEMILATATKNAVPSARPVMMKEYSNEGFKFYTNYESRKGQELAENPVAALTINWGPLHRVVRIEGTVEKTSSEDSDKYFKDISFPSQIATHIGDHSTIIASRNILITKERELLAHYKNSPVDRPPSWGGYIVKPHSIEFWQGQSDRLHDRIRFRRPQPNDKVDNVLLHQGENGWVFERLSP